MSSYMDKTPERALSCSRDGLYGLADLTCWPTLIGGASHRSVDARRSGDERRRPPSPPSMNSTISLLGECARRRLAHLTVAGLSFPRRPRTCYWVSAIARPCSSEHRNHVVCIYERDSCALRAWLRAHGLRLTSCYRTVRIEPQMAPRGRPPTGGVVISMSERAWDR